MKVTLIVLAGVVALILGIWLANPAWMHQQCSRVLDRHICNAVVVLR